MTFTAHVLKSPGSLRLNQVNVDYLEFRSGNRKQIIITLETRCTLDRQVIQASCSCSNRVEISLQKEVSVGKKYF